MQTKNFNAIPLWPLLTLAGSGRRRRRAFARSAGPMTAMDDERIAKAQAKRERKNAKRLSEAKR